MVIVYFFRFFFGFYCRFCWNWWWYLFSPINHHVWFGNYKKPLQQEQCSFGLILFAGLLPRLQSGTYDIKFITPLVFAVLLGGFVGSHFGSVRFDSIFIQKIMSAVIILAIIFLIQRIV